MKKIIALVISLVLLLSCAAAGAGFAEEDKLNVVVTIFPIYDWVREIVGTDMDHVNLTLLLDNGVDLHSYQPTADDLRKVAECDLFVHVGGESDGWVAPALAAAPNPRRRVLNLVEALGDAAKAEELVEGMEHEHHHHDAEHDDDDDDDHHHDAEHDDDDDDDDHHHHDDEDEIDEHVWLSLRNAAKLVTAIAADFAALDPDNAATYRANAAAYCKRLDALDRAYAAVVAKAARKTILVADRFPFRYLADDYGLTYFAAFAGCSAESEASFKTVAFLAKKVDEFKLPVILTMEGAKHKIAETVKRTTKAKDQRILTLDSLQSTGGEAAKTTHYLDVMTRNLEALKTALN